MVKEYIFNPYMRRKPTIWHRHQAAMRLVTSLVNFSRTILAQCCCCCSSWAVHELSRLISYAVALVGTVVYCIFVILGSKKYSTLSYPLLITATLCAVLYLSPPSLSSRPTPARKPSQWTYCAGKWSNGPCRKYLYFKGDPNMNIMAVLIVVVPTISYFILGVTKRLREYGIPTTEKEHGHIANVFGKLAAITMSFFLIPVSRHSILLKCVGLDPNHAIRIHTWAGTIALVGGLSHGLYYILIWIFISAESLWEKIMPPSKCWTLHAEDGDGDEDSEKWCITLFVNLTGILAGTCFIGLGLTSIWWVRRNYYHIFITCHIVFSVVLLFLLTMHYYKMILYLAPSLLYYLASSMPIWVESIQSWMQGGILITDSMHISNRTVRGCVEIALSHTNSPHSETKFETCCGKYVRICVPEISSVWHPFSIYHSNENDDLKIMFKGTGPFTEALSKRLQQSSNPKVLVDGLYGGETRISDALRHGSVVIIAGGVGITSYMSMIFLMCSEWRKKEVDTNENNFEDDPTNSSSCENTPQKIIVHWLCRDEELIEHFNDLYFAKLDANFPIQIVIHHTNKNIQREDDQCNPTERNVQQNLSIDDSQMQSSDTCEKFERGISFEHGMSSWGMKGNTLHNLPQAILFASIAWGSQWLILYFYKNVQGKYLAVHKRSFIIFALAGFALVSCLVFFLVKKIILHCARSASRRTPYGNLQTTSNDGNELQNYASKSQDDYGTDRLHADPKMFDEERRSNMPVGVQHSYGRPNIAMIISEVLDSGDDVGMFLCAPTSLKNSIKDSIRGHKQCALYEEISEL